LGVLLRCIINVLYQFHPLTFGRIGIKHGSRKAWRNGSKTPP